MMHIRSPIKTAAVLLSVGGLGLGLIGSGVRAAMLDAGSGKDTITVGTVACGVTSTDPLAVTSGNSLTITEPPILSSAAGSSYIADMTVTNNGTLPVNVV